MTAVVSTIFAIIGLLFIVTGVLSAIGRLPRNHVVGYRFVALYASDDAWRRGHRAAAAPTLVAGAACLIGAIGVLTSGDDDALAAWALGTVVALGVLTLIGAVLAVRAARSCRA